MLKLSTQLQKTHRNCDLLSLGSASFAHAEKIEFMRRAIGVNSFSAAGDQLQLLDLLGEGTFGKVYKGRSNTRSTVVSLLANSCRQCALRAGSRGNTGCGVQWLLCEADASKP